MHTAADIQCFADDPTAYFGRSRRAMHTLPAAELAGLQLAALRMRFEQLCDRVPVLRTMADEQRIRSIDRLDDAAPLLFPHTVYKSYPVSLLTEGRFDRLTQWLARLTPVDLSGLDTAGCESIDGWLDLLDTRTELRLAHSSGTSGTMSFVPHSAVQYARLYDTVGLEVVPGAVGPVDCLWPGFRTGRSGIARHATAMEEQIAREPGHFHALHPGHLSADVMFLAGRLSAAAAQGSAGRVALPGSLRARQHEFEEARRAVRDGMGPYARRLAERLRGRPVVALATWDVYYRMAEAGLALGLEELFAPGSVFLAGGSKEAGLPDDWEDAVRRFTGLPSPLFIYAMTEVIAVNFLCSQGRYHIEPSAVLYVLDPGTGAPLPREGVRTGRAAFYDLTADLQWGGFVSGDEVTVDWSPCPCGRTTAHLARDISRYGDQQGGDDKITCAASAEALGQALEFLNTALV
ncbi:hypothetical protein GCM10010129_01180 [Streptomyces fumigatiscleroticus]|nr:hypothetical protein GCM10010129_01180 [Streptomyces fumigatiscleroticus]